MPDILIYKNLHVVKLKLNELLAAVNKQQQQIHKKIPLLIKIMKPSFSFFSIIFSVQGASLNPSIVGGYFFGRVQTKMERLISDLHTHS